MGTIKSEQGAYKAGSKIGAYLKELGFNVDFAPDADVLTNENNTVILSPHRFICFCDIGSICQYLWCHNKHLIYFCRLCAGRGCIDQ